jgi:hypothetical protein
LSKKWRDRLAKGACLFIVWLSSSIEAKMKLWE